MTTSFKERLALFLPLVAVVILGLAATVYTLVLTDRSIKESIQEEVRILALSINPDLISTLEGSERDISKSSYKRVKMLLGRLHATDPDVEFLYVMGERDGEVFFYVDSEDPASEDYSPPGQVYDEATPELRSLFEGRTEPVLEFSRDRWGWWLSALAPIVDAETEQVVGVIGEDLDVVSTYATKLALAGALPLILTLLVCFVILSTMRARRTREESIREKAEVLAIASHEVRTPLIGILWATEVLMKHPGNDPEATKRRITEVHNNALRIIERINNLLTFHVLESTGGQLAAKKVILRVLIERVITSLSLVMESRHIGIEINPALTYAADVYADQDKLEVVFSNLLANAVKYAKEGTKVRVGYSSDTRAHKIPITNEGRGMSKDEQKDVFTYHRAENSEGRTGTGIGLPLSKKIIEMHQGRIEVDSHEEGPTTFTVILPKISRGE